MPDKPLPTPVPMTMPPQNAAGSPEFLGILQVEASGHKTANVFRRYDIVDEQDLRGVAEKLDSQAQAHTSVIQAQQYDKQGSHPVEKKGRSWR